MAMGSKKQRKFLASGDSCSGSCDGRDFRASGVDSSGSSCDDGGSALEGIVVMTTSGTNTDGSVSSGDTPKVERTRKRKSAPRESPSLRSSAYRGVTRHRWTGRYEAHLWDKDWLNTSRKKKGRQVYLGAYDEEEAAARAYDLAALKFWGRATLLNFPLSRYEEELKEMEGLSKEEYVGSLRRKSSGFSRGVSKYRGVARHHQNGRWEARIGKVFGNKYLYLGTYATQEEAAKAYDMAAIQYRGLNAVTNFDVSRYATHLIRPTPTGLDADPNSSRATASCSSTSDHSLAPGGVPPAINFHPPEDGRSPVNTQPWDGGDSPAPEPGLLRLHTSSFEQRERVSTSTLAAAAPEVPPSTPPESFDSTRAPSRCSFPDDVQTYFGCQDSAAAADVDDFVFGDLDAFVSSVFQWEGMLGC